MPAPHNQRRGDGVRTYRERFEASENRRNPQSMKRVVYGHKPYVVRYAHINKRAYFARRVPCVYNAHTGKRLNVLWSAIERM